MAMSRLILTVAFVTSILFCGATASAGGPVVVQLNSYHPGHEWGDAVLEGIREGFCDAGVAVDLRVEYMDAKHISDPVHLENLRRLYAHKYADQPVDLVIASDDQAFNFLKEYGREVFPGLPVVFCGLNYYTPDKVRGWENVTGVVEPVGIRETLDVALRLHPERRKVYIVNDLTPTGIANRQAADEAIRDYPGDISFFYLEGLPAGDLREILSKLDDESLVLLLSYNRDPSGRYLSYPESARFVSGATAVPVYAVFQPTIGHGVVGGYTSDPVEQGRIAAELAVRILNGTPAGSIPVVTGAPGVYIFDARQLHRFRIPVTALPPGCRIIPEVEMVSVPRDAIIIATLGVSGLIVIIILLSALLITRRRAARRVQEQMDLMQAFFDRSFDPIFRLRPTGEIIYTSPAAVRVLSYRQDELEGREFSGLISAGYEDDFRQAMEKVLNGDSVEELRLSLLKKDDGTAMVEVNAHPITGDDGRIMEIGAIVRDVTDRLEWERQREMAYLQLERNNEQFAILADHIRNPLQAIMGATYLISETRMQEIIQQQVARIDATIRQLDEGCIRSRWIRDFLRKHDDWYRETGESDQED